MKKLLFLLLALTVSAPAFAQTQTQYYTVPTIAALKAMTTSRPAVVEVVDANPGIFNLSSGACSAADDIFQVQPTAGTTVCYTRMATPYFVGKSATVNGVLVTGGTGVPSVSTTLPNMNIGTPTAGVGTNITGTAAGLTAGNVTTNANLTGDVTSSGNATTLATVASAGTTGSSTAIPVVTINAKGLTTGITTAAVVAPAGTLTGTTLAANVVTSSLTSVGTLTSLATSGAITQTIAGATIARHTKSNATRSWTLDVYGTDFAPNGSFNIADVTGSIVRFSIETSGLTTVNGVFNLTTGKTYQINSTNVLSASTLGSGVTTSSLTSFGNSPTLVTPNLGTPSFLTLTNATGLPNAGLVNSATTVNGQTCTLGSTCTITAVSAAGTLTGTTLASNVVTSSLTSLGTIASLNYTAMNVGTQTQIVGSITGSTLTVDATYQGAVAAGMYIWVPKTAHITYGTYIVSGAGATWTLSAAVASPIASTTINLTTGLAAHTGWFGGDDIYHSTKFASNRDTTATLPYSAEVTSQNVMRSNTGLYVTATVTNASPAVVTMTGGLPFASCAGCNTSFTFYDNGDTLPSPLNFVTTYYVRGSTISGNSFEISLTAGGAAINTTTAGSGTHAILTKFFSYKIAGTATALGGPLSGNLYARNDIVRGYGGAGGYIVKGYEVDVTNYGADATSLTASTYVVGLASILSNEGALTTAKGTAAFWAYAANSQWYRAYAHSGDSNSILWSSGTSVDGVDFTSATISGSPFKSTGFTVTNTGAVTGATLTSSGDILAAAASSIYWTGRSLLQSPSDGVVAFKNNGGTQGVAIDGSTSTFKVRDRANSSDANLTASTISASGNVNVATGQAYLVNSVSTLTATTLGSAVVNSSLTSVGTITTGTWNAGTVTSSGIISAAAASGYQLGGVAVITRDGDYTRFKDNATNIGLTIGNATNPSNYYSNTNHGFYSRNSAVNFATLNVTGFTVYGTLTATLASTAQTNVACYNSTSGLFTYQTAASGCAVSSARFKENITVKSNADALKVVTSLEPVKFQYKASAGMDRNWHDGFIAEQVAKVAPDLVEFEKDGKTPRAVKYQEMAPYFAGAIRELKAANDNLKAEIAELKKEVK